MSFIRDIGGSLRTIALVLTVIMALFALVGYFFMGIFVAMIILSVLVMVLMAIARPRY